MTRKNMLIFVSLMIFSILCGCGQNYHLTGGGISALVPSALDDHSTLGVFNSPHTVNPHLNDSADLDPSTTTIVMQPPSSEGACFVGGMPNYDITFSPAPHFAGTTSCNYQVCDSSLSSCSVATVYFYIDGGAFPDATDDFISGSGFGNPIIANQTSNDTDLDGNLDLSSITIITDAHNVTEGSCTVGGAPNYDITFVPVSHFTGVATCVYQICDLVHPTPQCDTATIYFDPDDGSPPVANDDTANGTPGSPISFNVISNDIDSDGNLDLSSLTIISNANPSTEGSCSVGGPPNYEITFTPVAGFTGTTSCSYQICDSNSPTPQCDTATVTYSFTSPAQTNSSEDCEASAVDNLGNSYCVGKTFSALAESSGGRLDFFVSKFDVNGDLVWIRQGGSGYTQSQIATLTSSNGGGDTSQDDICLSVAIDSNYNVICSGSTKSSLAETNGGGEDVFVIKFDMNGDVVWVRQFGASGGYSQSQLQTLTGTNGGGNTSRTNVCEDVEVDSLDNIYCVGYVWADGFAERSGGGNDIIALKLDPMGDLVWARQMGRELSPGVGGYWFYQLRALTLSNGGGDTYGMDFARGVKLDTTGNIYITGTTSRNLAESDNGTYDLDFFLLKVDQNGDLVWVRQGGGVSGGYTHSQINAIALSNGGGDLEGNDYLWDLGIDSSGNIICGGSTSGSVGELNTTTRPDVLVIKFDPNGDVIWVHQTGDNSGYYSNQLFSLTSTNGGGISSTDDVCYDLEVSASDHIYCAGVTSSHFAEERVGGFDPILTKIDPNGDLVWARQVGNTGRYSRSQLFSLTSSNGASSGSGSINNQFQGVAVDASENIIVSGYTSRHSFAEEQGGAFDLIHLKFDSNGDLVWARQAGKPGRYTYNQIPPH